MHSRTRLVLAPALGLALALVPACVLARNTTNEPILPSTVARLEPGTTTARAAVELLGSPTEVVQLGRRTAYRYDSTTSKRAGLWLVVVGLYGSDTHSDRVWLFFDENEVLTHYGATLRAKDAEYALPWERVHE